ncbi:MAG: mechanosensitive ion channel [Rhodobacteraceae bacterium]|nr:mechanosensitive ion channel [Paracoccaceae bacterium]
MRRPFAVPSVPALLAALFLTALGGLPWLSPAMAQPPEAATSAPAPDAALDRLIEVLNDDAARAALLEALTKATAEAPAPPPGPPAAEPSIGAQVAEFTQAIAQNIASQIQDMAASIGRGNTSFRGLSGEELGVLVQSAQNLFLIIAITVAVFVVLRRLSRPVFRRMDARARDANALRLSLLFAGSVAINTAIVLGAWAIGYAIALLAFGDLGRIDFRQTLYLNAFLMVELIKVAVRAVLSPANGGLRLINLSDRAARHLHRHAALIFSIVGYGQLLVVPIVNRNVSYAAGIGIAAILSVLVLIYLFVLVIRHRTDVADWLARGLYEDPATDPADGATETAPGTPDHQRPGGFLGTLIRSWHWFLLAYLAFMFFVVVLRPTRVVVDHLTASGQVLAAAILGSLLMNAIGKPLRTGIRLPEDIATKLPLLQPRLNRVIPKFLIALRFLVAAGVIGYALDVIGIAEIGAWLASDLGLDLTGRLASAAAILTVAALVWLAVNSWVDYQLSPNYGTLPTSRETTLLSLLRNAATIAIVIFTLMFALSELGLDIGPLLASAGVLGLAIGFGAQKLVQDIITGIFIQLENAMNVGDVVTVGGTTGVVEKLTVRSASLRDINGTFHIIPFSSVDMVSNFMRDFAFHVCDMGIAYREDIDEAKQAMMDGFDELLRDPEQRRVIVGDLEWFGLNSFGDSAIVLRARIKTQPGKQWGVGRAYNAILKRLFDERGIEIPFPHQTIFFGEAKDGSTQALRLRNVDRSEGET